MKEIFFTEMISNDILKIANMILFMILFNLSLISHIKCVFSNPGTIPTNHINLEEEKLPI
jgi:hypothetical protein